MSIAEAFEGVLPDRPVVAPAPQVKQDPKPAVARAPAVDTGRVRSVLAAATTTAVNDVKTAWPWHGSPPSPYDLWQQRIPDLEQVPGENRALWLSWVVFNHVALVLSLLLAVPLWVLQHPARTITAATIAAPFITLWIFG